MHELHTEIEKLEETNELHDDVEVNDDEIDALLLEDEEVG
jgi:hypothetical protein